MVRVDVEVEDLNDLESALMKGVNDGAGESRDWMLDEGKNKAQDFLRLGDSKGHSRIWRRTVYSGFVKHRIRYGDVFHGRLENTAPHAHIVELGRRPGATPPQVQDLMEWVVTKLSPAIVIRGSGGFGDDDFDEGAGGGVGLRDPHFTVTEWKDPNDLGIPEQQFNSESVIGAKLGDGTTTAFKSWRVRPDHADDIDDWEISKFGEAVRNEVVWSRAQEMLDWDLGPKSRTADPPQEGMSPGTLQEWVEGSEDASKHVYFGWGNIGTDHQTRDEFLAEHNDWRAQTVVLDYLLGNEDRHKRNFVIDADGNPRAIDNGGEMFNEGLNGQYTLGAVTEFHTYDTALDPERLHNLNHEYVDEMEDLLDAIAQDEELREQLVEEAAEIHGEGSNHHRRLQNVLGVGNENHEDHILYDGDDDGVPQYKEDLQLARESYDVHYNNGEGGDDHPWFISHDDEEDFDFDYDEDLMEIDDMLNDLMGNDVPEELQDDD